jgi:hypothetical protein
MADRTKRRSDLRVQPNKALHWVGIPLRSIPASELGRWAGEWTSDVL